MYKKILVPLDGSDLAECTFNHLKHLFKDSAAGEVILLNAVEAGLPWKDMNIGDDIKPVRFDYRAFVDALMDKAKQYLAKTQSRFSSQGLTIKTVAIESNSASDTITDYAQKNGVDLIVIATHGYSGMKKMLLGSVASKVLNQSHVPVLLIRPEACFV
jgi:nucleotide-binding universal stress UspA family protein